MGHVTEAGPIDALGEPKDEQVVAGRPVIGPIQSHVTGCTADGRQDMQLFASGRVFFFRGAAECAAADLEKN